MSATLYTRLGGASALDEAVEIFYRKVLADTRINRFFADVDMRRQVAKQRAFLSYAFGGTSEYTGNDMRRAHARLVKNGLDDRHFDAVMEHLASTLTEMGVADALIGEAAAIAESTRQDVLGR